MCEVANLEKNKQTGTILIFKCTGIDSVKKNMKGPNLKFYKSDQKSLVLKLNFFMVLIHVNCFAKYKHM